MIGMFTTPTSARITPALSARRGSSIAACSAMKPRYKKNRISSEVSRLKINATVGNARAFLAVQREFGSFDAYVWGFVGGQPLVNTPATLAEVPAETAESRALSAALKRRGFRFVGPTIMYAYMQAVGCWVEANIAGGHFFIQLFFCSGHNILYHSPPS